MNTKNIESATRVSYQDFTKNVVDLKGYNFYVPSYQRGYRWTTLQVRQLLDDVYDFKGDTNTWYCIQPLVVQKQGDLYVVVDGQQRLTTLSIVLSVLDRMILENTTSIVQPDLRPYKIIFERDVERQEGMKAEDLLKLVASKIPDKARNSYADNFCICESADAVFSWAEKKFRNRPKALNEYADKIRSQVRFIWYVAKQDKTSGYEVFERLNSGKISLSNAELIKACLLTKGGLDIPEGKTEDVVINETAKEWDAIERQLRQDDFWYFINPEADAERFSATRIDFLFELLLRSELLAKKKGWERTGEPNVFYGRDGVLMEWARQDDYGVGVAHADINYMDEVMANPYFSFYALTQSQSGSGSTCNLTKVWMAIKLIFQVLIRWYNDRRTYHLVGFMMNQKGAKIDTLIELLYSVKVKSHSAFVENVLMGAIRDVVAFEYGKSQKTKDGLRNEDFEKYLSKLSYQDTKGDKGRIYDVLLLFNIILMDRQHSELSRYPFAEHSKISAGWKAGWSLEHIHAKQEEILISDLCAYEKYFNVSVDSDDLSRRVEALNHKDRLYRFNLKLQIEKDADAKMHLEVAHNGSVQDDAFVTHGIGNMALLDCSRNAEFNNGSFIKKREILANWERGDRESEAKFLGDFVPVGTKMVFYKHYVENLTDDFPLAWTEKNRCDYVDTIERTITAFLTPKEN